jgi:hypothetical protein
MFFTGTICVHRKINTEIREFPTPSWSRLFCLVKDSKSLYFLLCALKCTAHSSLLGIKLKTLQVGWNVQNGTSAVFCVDLKRGPFVD